MACCVVRIIPYIKLALGQSHSYLCDKSCPLLEYCVTSIEWRDPCLYCTMLFTARQRALNVHQTPPIYTRCKHWWKRLFDWCHSTIWHFSHFSSDSWMRRNTIQFGLVKRNSYLLISEALSPRLKLKNPVFFFYVRLDISQHHVCFDRVQCAWFTETVAWHFSSWMSIFLSFSLFRSIDNSAFAKFAKFAKFVKFIKDH